MPYKLIMISVGLFAGFIYPAGSSTSYICQIVQTGGAGTVDDNKSLTEWGINQGY